MSKVVNLNKARKAKVRAEKTQRASQNAVKFGRTKAERKAAEAAQSKQTRTLDGKKLE
ncbi:MAG: DUF4169 family protein [Thalassovita sp.]